MRKFALFLLVFAFVSIQVVNAQVRRITGTVTGSADRMPIPGASVVVKGTSIGTITNVNGTYQLDVPQDATTLMVSFVGMKTAEVAITGSTVNVALETDVVGVDEVMVVAYGTAKKASFTGSAATVSNQTIEKRTVSSVTKALEGTVAGLQSTSGGGQPGSNSSVIIRGFGSINASNNPLYVLDGIPFDGNLSILNPNDIESVTVLKDASASALYGSRAANGVIMITTKKGQDRAGKDVSVNLKGSWGISSRALKPYNTVDEKGFMEVMYDTYRNDLIYVQGFTPSVAATRALANMSSATVGFLGRNEQYNPFNFKVAELIDPVTGKVRDDAELRYSENWMDELTDDSPLRQEYQIQVQGGDVSKTRWITSLSYLDEEGILKTTKFNRYTGLISVDSKINEWAKSGLSANFSQSSSNYAYATGSALANVWYTAQRMGPIYPVFEKDANGDDVLDALGKRVFDYGVARPSGATSDWNTVATLYDDKAEVLRHALDGRTYLELAPATGVLQGLKFTTNFGFHYGNANDMTYYNPYNGNARATSGRITKSNGRTLSYTFNQLLNYTKTIQDWGFDLLVGHEFYNYKYDYLSAQKTGFPFGGLYELAAASTIADATSYQDNYRIESYLSRLNINFREKIYLSGSYRTDGSSRFHQDYRWGDFWSVGASYRISEEPFMASQGWLDNLTLKASFGESGNDRVGTYYAWQALYNLGQSNANLPGAVIASLENKTLKWEKNTSLNVGFDARIFRHIDIGFEYFERYTSDLLLSEPMALSTGFATFLNNVGEMKNTGFEMRIATPIVNLNNFSWKVTALGTTIKNEVVALAGGKDEIATANYITKVGKPINSFYVAKAAGVDPLTGKQLYWGLDENKDEYITSDVNVAANSRQILGSRIPDLYGSLTNEFMLLKNIDLYVFTTYSIGGKVLESFYSGIMYPMYPGTTFHSNIERRWRNPGDITDVPRAEINSTDRITDKYLIDASYFAIKNITLGYTIPKRLLNLNGISSVRIFATADNLKLFSNLEGMDPQYNFSGGVDYVYTPNKTISMGVDIKF